MAPDFGLIPDAAQGQADIFPVQGLCNRLAKRGLAGSGRTYQEENAALVVSPELHDGQMLQDPLLHLLQAVVVVVQNLLGVLEVGLFPFLQVPGEGEDEVQIVPYHGSLGRALGLVIQTVELVQSRVFNFFGEPGLGDPLPVVLLLPPLAAGLAVFRVPVILVQFLLDGGHLLLQHLLPIVFVRPLGHALIDTDIPVQGLPLLDQDIHEVQGPVPVGIGFQESADRACGALVRSELLTREKLALLRRAVFERIGRWQGSVDRILVAETAIVLGGLDNWTAADFRGSEAFLPFLPWRFQFHPNRSKALFISFLEEARTLGSKNYNRDEWTRFEQGLAESLCFNVAGRFPDFRNLVGRCELIMLVTSYSGTPSLAAQTEFSCAALAVQLAAEEFRRDKGGYPAALEELVPGYLPEVPKDPFDDGRPIKYNPETRVLYTVGPDRAFTGKLPSKDELDKMSRGQLRGIDHCLRNLDGSPLPLPEE